MATIAKHSVERTKRRWAYVFLSVPLMFYVSIRFYPTLFAFFLAFTDWNIVSKNMNFVGFENFTRLFSDQVFWITLQNTFKYVILGLPISLLIGFILAYQIDRVKGVDGLYKAMYFIPYITSMVAVAWVWRWLYQPVPIGVFNNILSSLGFPTQPFLSSTTQALPAILGTTVWADLGFQMIIFLAGIKAISPNLFEAARYRWCKRSTDSFSDNSASDQANDCVSLHYRNHSLFEDIHPGDEHDLSGRGGTAEFNETFGPLYLRQCVQEFQDGIRCSYDCCPVSPDSPGDTNTDGGGKR